MLEAWILNASYAFKGDQDVINYISFAATIASLLLAVLAIIYGFVQADGQQKSASSLESQLDGMRGAQSSLTETATSLKSHLSAIASTTSVLQGISDAIEKNNTQLGTLHGRLSSLQEAQAAYFDKRAKDNQAEASAVGPEQSGMSYSRASVDCSVVAAEQILTKSTYQADLLGYALLRAFQAAGKNKIDLFQFLKKFYSEPLKLGFENKPDLMGHLPVGYQLIQALGAIGFVSAEPGKDSKEWDIEISPENLDHLKRFALAVPSQSGTGAIATLIDAVKW